MASIGQGVGDIQAQHQAARAQNAQNNEQINKQTEAQKQEAIANAGSAFDEINNNHSDTLTGAITEGAKDIGGAIEALGTAGAAAVADAISDAATAVQGAAYDVGSYIAEGAESAGSVLSDIGTAIGGFFKGLFAAGTQGAQQALDDKYNE